MVYWGWDWGEGSVVIFLLTLDFLSSLGKEGTVVLALGYMW